MAAPDLPQPIQVMLASAAMREHHMFWHQGREWARLSASDRVFLEQRGYRAPRQVRQAGAGLDFLGMHRNMIETVNEQLAGLNVPDYPAVTGWNPIPFDHNDADYPMPPLWETANPRVAAEKSPGATAHWRQMVAQRYENDEWLRNRPLDEIGTEIETGIHNWLHTHWSSEPWYKGLPGQDRNDVRNDYLGSTYASHVNKHFWKLHGWIDDRIVQWERVNQTAADFSEIWNGPHQGHHHMMAHGFRAKRREQSYESIPESLHAFSDNFFVRQQAE